MKESMTTPFRTATPETAMKPTPALIENGMPRRNRAMTPPVIAKGMPVNTKAASPTEWKVMNNKTKISRKVSGTTTIRRARPESRCSHMPPHSRR
jgi:hypothetical protein